MGARRGQPRVQLRPVRASGMGAGRAMDGQRWIAPHLGQVQVRGPLHIVGNGDGRGSIEFSDTTPVAGVVFKVTPTLNIYGNAGKGFETPTFAELAYRSTLATVNGFNFDLKPAESTNYEVGVKAYLGSSTRVNAAVFKIDTKNEIVVFSNSAGRSVFQNVDSTTRKGFELGVDSNLGNGFTGVLSYTYIDASFDNSFGTCVGVCTSVAGPPAAGHPG